MRKGYVLEAALILLLAVVIFVAAIISFVSNTSALRVSQEKLLIASNNAMNGLQMGTSFIAHYANVVGGFSLNFNSGQPGVVSFSSIPWLQQNTSNNFFNGIYSSTDGAGWKVALSTLATGTNNVLYLNQIPAVQSFFQTLHASGVFTSTPDVVIIQTKLGGYINNSRYFIVSRSVVGGSVAYASGFVVANGLNRYVYFTQEEPPYASPFYNVTFITGDTVDGPVRTNGTLVTLGSPDFKSLVQYGNIYEVSGDGSPTFESGAEQLSQSDINSMNMSMIASQYSAQINSEVASPVNLSKYSTPVGLDLSSVYKNLINNLWKNYGFSSNNYKWTKKGYYTLPELVRMFTNDFNYWASNNGYTDQNGNINWSQLPDVIHNDYNNVISAIYGIPSLQVTFSPGNSGSSANTITISYGIDTSNAIAAIDHLRTDVNMYSYEYNLNSIGQYLYNGYFDWNGNYYPNTYDPNIYDVLELGYANPQWQKLLQINPTNGVPGNSILTIQSGSNRLLGLNNGSGSITFNFNGVIKTTSDLVIGDGTNQFVSGKYTLYTTRSSIINGNIVYNYANQLLGANSSKNNWINSPVSSSTVAKIRNATGIDALNIVSNYDVTLANSMSQYAKVMASIYAFNGSFWYPNYEYATWGSWMSSQTGQLFVFGSMAQYEGGQLFGTYSNGQISTGYNAYYAFDWRNLSGMPSNMYGTPSAQGKALLLAVRTTF